MHYEEGFRDQSGAPSLRCERYLSFVLSAQNQGN